jgi:hypothetical protein
MGRYRVAGSVTFPFVRVIKKQKIRRFFMKNKILFLGSLCVVLALGLVFIGCETEVPVVDHPDFDEIVPRVSRAGNGEAAWTAGQSVNVFLVAWTGVEGANYYTVFRQSGKVSYVQVGDPQNVDKYTISGNTFIDEDNTDRDEWSSFIPATGTGSIVTTGGYPANSTITGQFGLIIAPYRSDRNPVIVWDDVEYELRF